jgi:hypothetical protein
MDEASKGGHQAAQRERADIARDVARCEREWHEAEGPAEIVAAEKRLVRARSRVERFRQQLARIDGSRIAARRSEAA